MIAENEPTLFGGDQKLFAARLAYHQRNAEEELLLIEMIRKQVARILRTLKPEDFQRRGIHSEAGPLTLERSFSEAPTTSSPCPVHRGETKGVAPALSRCFSRSFLLGLPITEDTMKP